MAGGEATGPATYDGAHSFGVLDGSAEDFVGYTIGKIDTFEQLGDWTIMDVANSVGIYLDEGSFIKIKRKLNYLPPIDTSSGWLSTNHFFGYDSKIEKYIFGDDSGAKMYATEASNSPGYTGVYEDWEAWSEDPAGYPAKNTVGYYQYLDFYDYHDRYFGKPVSSDGYPTESPGALLGYNRDENQLLRYNKIAPQTGENRFAGYPTVDPTTTQSINDLLEGAYSGSPSWSGPHSLSVFSPTLANRLGSLTSPTGLGMGATYDVLYGAEYEIYTTWCTYFNYVSGDYSAAITERYITPEMATLKMETAIKEYAASAATQKISSSSKFSEHKQVAKKFSKNNLSAIVRGSPSITDMSDATMSAGDSEMFTYDTEGGADMPEGGADDYSY